MTLRSLSRASSRHHPRRRLRPPNCSLAIPDSMSYRPLLAGCSGVAGTATEREYDHSAIPDMARGPDVSESLRVNSTLISIRVQPSLGAGSPLGEGSTAVNDTLALAANATGLAANETASEDGVLLWDLLLRPASTGGKLLYASWDSWYNGDQNTYLPNSLFGNADIGTSVPGFIFRGQILSITLAAVLIGFILLREWITQHNWAEHDPRPVRKEADLEPDQWTVRGGVAFRNEDVLAAFGHSAETGPLTASAAAGQGDQSLRASSQKIEDIIDRLTAVPSGRVSILSDDRRAHLADALKRMKEDIDGHDAENEKHRRIDAQKKMSVWHPVLNLESLDHPTNPISNGNDVVRSASSSSFQPRSPISSPPAGDDSFSTDRASAGPSRPSAISVSPYQFRLPPHSATATSASDPNPESDLRLTPALTSPGGGPPRPAAPLKAVAGLAYTAPEMLSPKGKGKVQAIEVFGEYVEDVSGPNTGPDSDKAAHDDRPNGDVLKGIVPFSDGDGAEPPPAYNDGRPIIGDPPDTAVPDDRMKISIGADFSATSDDSPTLRDPNKLDDQPQDLAYRDLSSGQQSPSTVSASTIPASGDDSAVTSPHVEAIALAEEPGEVDHAAPRVLEAPFGPENRQANGEDVDVQFIADDEEEAHWEREDWDGVLEGESQHLTQYMLITFLVIGLIGPLQGMLQNVSQTFYDVHPNII